MQTDVLAPAAAPRAAKPYSAHFRCFRGCPGEYSVYDVMYTCPNCGGLLEVHHDVDALRDRSAAEWKALLRKPRRQQQVALRQRRLGHARMGDARASADENVVSMYEGNTNLFWADRLGKQIGVPDLWVKLCGNSHTGSLQGPGHDGAGQRGQADDGQRQPRACRGRRQHGRHLGGAGRLCRLRRHPRHHLPALGQGLAPRS